MICPNCGKEIENQNISEPKKAPKQDIFSFGSIDSIGWWLIGMLLPVIGIIWGAIWKNSHPTAAKSLKSGSKISFFTSLILAIAIYMLIIDFGWALGLANIRITITNLLG